MLATRQRTVLLIIVTALTGLGTLALTKTFWEIKLAWPQAKLAFPEYVRTAMATDSTLARTILSAQQWQLDSASRINPWLKDHYFLGQELFSPDTLAQVLRPRLDSSIYWGSPRDSIDQQPHVLERSALDSLARLDSILHQDLQPSTRELWLAACLALPQRLYHPFQPVPAQAVRICVWRAMELYERIVPGQRVRYQRLRISNALARSHQQLHALRTLHRYARSLGIPEAQWPFIMDVAHLSLRNAMLLASPQDPDWHALVVARAKFLTPCSLAMPAGSVREILADSVKIQTVSQRLGWLGYGNDSTPLAMRLESFQANFGRKPTGKLDDTTLLELFRSDSLRAQSILQTLDSLRNSPWSRESFYVKVNIPEFILEAIENGKVIRTHRVVVGKDTVGRFTPALHSRLERIVINPEWHIPTKILKEEIVGSKPFNEATLLTAGYQPKYDKDHKITGAFQPAGEENALGMVKILFANPYGVYIHDTPSRYLFARRFRAFSHGCVRLDKPMEFARFLLERDQHRLTEKFDSLQELGDQKWLKLNTSVPVHFEYRTVVPDSLGRACFLKDIYALARERARLQRLADRERLKKLAMRSAKEKVVDR